MCSFCSEAAFQPANYSATVSGEASPNAATGVSNSSVTGDNNTNALLSGYSWGSTSLTWRIPQTASDYDTSLSITGIQYDDQARATGWLAPTAVMTTATAFILNELFAGVSSLTFTALAGSNINADLTIGRSLTATTFQTAYAYYPTGPGAGLSGDSWFSNTYDSWGASYRLDSPKTGGYNWYTYIHEFGHNMGLKHGHETDGTSNTAMNADRDSMEFSVMTYRSHIGSNPAGGATNEAWGFAQSLMMYDIAALQVMYGANFNENSGNSVYTFSTTTGEMFIDGIGQGTPGGNRIFRTVWDGNGTDTYDFSNYTSNLTVDLSPGGWSVLSTVQLANLGQGFIARGNMFNALQFNGDIRSLIENATGGAGADTIIGNAADNVLSGGAGNDTISGGGGNDTIYGGAGAVDATETGNDTLSGGDGADSIYGNGGNDVITGGTGADFLIGGTGNDTLYGGLNATDTTDLCDDFMRGGDGTDTLYGNSGNDTVLGGAGVDTIYGGDGNDILYGGAFLVDATDSGDFIYGGAGNDDIRGNGGDDVLYGEAGDDSIIGGIGDDYIFGGFGNDYLRGGDGADRFIFETALNATTNVDTIQNFVVNVDDIYLSQAIFTGIGATLDADEFQIGVADAATDRIIYDQTTGQLFYDSNGNASGGCTLFAILNPGTALTINDFAMVA